MAYDTLGPADAPGSVTVRPTDARSVGITDTWFKDCTSDDAADGTALHADWLNGVLAQARALLRGNGLTGSSAAIVTEVNSDDGMLLKSIQHLIQRGQVLYGVDTGAANALTVSLSPALAEYKAGLEVRVKILHDNTGPTTLNINANGNVPVKYVDGGALLALALKVGQIATFCHDGTNFQLTSVSAPTEANHVFSTRKPGTQGLSNGVFGDVTWNAATCAFGTFDGTTFTFTQAGTYIFQGGLTIETFTSVVTNSNVYVHHSANWSTTHSGGLLGWSDEEFFLINGGSIGSNSLGVAIAFMNAGETVKVQAYSAASPNWNSGDVNAASFWTIARI